MLVFPQLSTGAAGQFPLTRTKARRTVVNTLADGRTVRYRDDTGEVSWDLDFRELSSAERGAVEALFAASEGRLRSFTFLDPADNLLNLSEVLTTAAWSKDPLLTVTPGIADPLGTQRAAHLVNAGQGNQGISQTLNVPASFTYCASAWVKGSGAVTLSGGSMSERFAASNSWTRLSLGGSPAGAAETVAFRLTLEAGSLVDVFGLQVEAQPGASGYKVTGAQGGVYSNARFTSDELRIAAEGPGRERAQLRIVAMTEN